MNFASREEKFLSFLVDFEETCAEKTAATFSQKFSGVLRRKKYVMRGETASWWLLKRSTSLLVAVNE